MNTVVIINGDLRFQTRSAVFNPRDFGLEADQIERLLLDALEGGEESISVEGVVMRNLKSLIVPEVYDVRALVTNCPKLAELSTYIDCKNEKYVFPPSNLIGGEITLNNVTIVDRTNLAPEVQLYSISGENCDPFPVLIGRMICQAYAVTVIADYVEDCECKYLIGRAGRLAHVQDDFGNYVADTEVYANLAEFEAKHGPLYDELGAPRLTEYC